MARDRIVAVAWGKWRTKRSEAAYLSEFACVLVRKGITGR